jgi:hypothetical protein
MQRHSFSAINALLLAAAVPLSAQQLLQPTTPPPVNTPAQPIGIGPQLKQAQAAPTVPADIEQRAVTAEPIKSKGPADEAEPGFKPPVAIGAAKKPVGVIDALGRPLSGAVQVAPNRIYDPGSGRYYHTVPAGEQQKIVP